MLVATTQSVGVVPVREEIGWSSDLDHQLALLAEFSKLRAKLEGIQTPGPRYASKILPLLPTDTVLYYRRTQSWGRPATSQSNLPSNSLRRAKFCNSGGNKRGSSNQHTTPKELIDQVHAVSQYLGDEVVITARANSFLRGHGPVLQPKYGKPD